ncbi:MAG TPA: flagellin, partial [Aeromonadales bacterium]|nr:flagellin [Aeromonadales bacterium]
MASIISTNVASINAQRNLSRTNLGLERSLQRLSSGLRINSARDDAAGLQISNSLTSQVRGLTVAARNANDGISMAQVAEGALGESTNLLQRIRDLAIQSANGSNSVEERTALQSEVTQLQAEINRIANTTRFGGRSILNGSLSNVAFQVGAQANETISFSITSARATDLGRINNIVFTGFALADASASAASPVSTVDENQTLSFVVDGRTTTVGASVGDTAQAIQDAVNSTVSGVRADAKTTARITLTGVDNAADTLDITINGVQLSQITGTASVAASGAALKTAIESDARLSNLSVTDNGDGTVDIVDNDGANITFDDITFADGGGVAAAPTVEARNFANTAISGTATTVATTEGSVISGDIKFTGTASSAALFSSSATGGISTVTTQSAGAGTISDTGFRASTIDISTAQGAQDALDVIDASISQIDSTRASLGAVQNRLDSTISNLQSVIENVSAA